MVQVLCPQCHAGLSVPAHKLGSVSACPRCRQPIHLSPPRNGHGDARVIAPKAGPRWRVVALGRVALRTSVLATCAGLAVFLAWPQAQLMVNGQDDAANPILLMNGVLVITLVVERLFADHRAP